MAAVCVALGNSSALESLRAILASAQEEVESLAIPCRACGKCCDFAAMDHRLFVSTAELALLAVEPPPSPAEPLHCPYQQGGLCSARQRRPLGCRVFYCDSASQTRLNELYERYHQWIVALHQEWDIPYLYGEMTSWLVSCQVESRASRTK